MSAEDDYWMRKSKQPITVAAPLTSSPWSYEKMN
jgi:hypothetical protein